MPTLEAIYLDHNATTPVHAEVRDAMMPWLGSQFGNPSSAHAYGRAAAEALAVARAQVAAAIGAQPDEIVFTSGGTEADNLAIGGAKLPRPHLVTSAVEHPAVEAPAQTRVDRGERWTRLAVDARGVVDVERARPLLDDTVGMLSVILAQNEVGTVQPVAELAGLVRGATPDALIHSDAAQAVGKIPVDVTELGVDLLTIVSHKLYGPCGVGALFVRRGVSLSPLMGGGGQEQGLRPGTEPMLQIVGLGKACEIAVRDLEHETARQHSLRDSLWSRLQSNIPGIQWTAQGAELLPNTLHVCVEGALGSELLARAPAIAASTGSACHAHDDAVSGTLGEMGLSATLARGAIRLSLGRSTTPGCVETAANALIEAHRSLSGRL